MKQRLQAWGDSRIIQIACCFVFNDRGETLLLQRHSEDLGGGKWGTAGGKVEKGENARQAVLREVYEETGLRLDGILELGVHEIRMPHGADHMTSFRAQAPASHQIAINPEEHHAYAWFHLDNLLNEDGLLWGIPTILHDFGLLDHFGDDPTLADGSEAILLRLADSR